MTFLKLLQDSRAAVEDFFTEQWGEKTPIEYQEVAITKTMPYFEWVRPSFQLRFRPHRTRTLQCDPKDLTGLIAVQVFVEVPNGANGAEQRARGEVLVEEVRRIFDVAEITGRETVLSLDPPDAGETGPRHRYIQMNCTIGFSLSLRSSDSLEPF